MLETSTNTDRKLAALAEYHRVRHWMMLVYVLNIVFWLREDPSLFNWLLGAWVALLWAEEVTYPGTTHRIPARYRLLAARADVPLRLLRYVTYAALVVLDWRRTLLLTGLVIAAGLIAVHWARGAYESDEGMTLPLSSEQRGVLMLWAIAVAAICLYVPWGAPITYGRCRPVGYAPVWSNGPGADNLYVVDTARLKIEVLAATAFAGLGFLLVSVRKPANP